MRYAITPRLSGFTVIHAIRALILSGSIASGEEVIMSFAFKASSEEVVPFLEDVQRGAGLRRRSLDFFRHRLTKASLCQGSFSSPEQPLAASMYIHCT